MQVAEEHVSIALKPKLFGPSQNVEIIFTVPASLANRNRHLSVVGASAVQKTSPAVLAMFAKGRIWFEELVTGAYPSIDSLAQAEGVTRSYVGTIIDLAFASPTMVDDLYTGEAVFTGTAPSLKTCLPFAYSWADQNIPNIKH